MPFQQGNREYRKADPRRPRIIQQHLIAALNEVDTDNIPKLRRVVNALIGKAMEGDIAAIKEITDRVDGKVPQQVQGDVEAPLVIQSITRTIVRSKVIEHDDPPLKLVKGGE